MGGELQECQSEESAEQETRGCMSSGVGDVVEDLAAKSSYLFVGGCLFVGEKADIGVAELDFEAFDGFVGRDTDQAPTTGCAGTATAQSTTWQESANHLKLVLGGAVVEVVPGKLVVVGS